MAYIEAPAPGDMVGKDTLYTSQYTEGQGGVILASKQWPDDSCDTEYCGECSQENRACLQGSFEVISATKASHNRGLNTYFCYDGENRYEAACATDP